MLLRRRNRSSLHRSAAHSGGFTLIELMIVVAIVALLAGIAVPSFLRLQLKARRSEVFVNIRGIAIAEIAYDKLYDTYIDCASSPTTPLDGKAYPFDTSQDGWQQLEWAPDGKVRCHYYAQIFTNTKGSWVRATSLCDLDDNSTGSSDLATWYMDVDPMHYSPASIDMTLRPNTATAAGNLF